MAANLFLAKQDLEQQIIDALKEAKKSGIEAGKNNNSDAINEKLASRLTEAIHAYVTSAQVNITAVVSTVAPGVAVSTAGTAVTQIGATISPGIAQHAGFGKLQ